jgi:hypothetical protein
MHVRTFSPFTKDGFWVMAVLSGVALLGYIAYGVVTDPPDRWQDNVVVDQDLAREHCNNDYQCEDDLNVALSGCKVVHADDRDAMYLCQYRYMAKLGVRLPVRRKDGQWISGNRAELDASMNYYIKNCLKPFPNPKTPKEIDAMVTACLASSPPWRAK